MRPAWLALPAVIAVAAVACSSTLRAEDYDQACTVNEDCVTVFVGEICDCSCDPMGAVSKKGELAYREDRGSISCSKQCKPCANRDVPVCNAGTCAAQRCAGMVKYCAPSCGAPATFTACECPAGTVDKLACSTDAGAG
ncbi:MAG: hypothetical protein JST00_25935 [Deltaproteobacteria bacterium]|nr:hypothetical protein [Deltaproteobacteria bacterium]